MIKIKKIYLQNFKGIKPRTIFDFDSLSINVNILSGPNGFGKTTIFEVIELCLTGEFNRVEWFDTVQKKNKDRNKPFFQNTDGENVILKLWIENTATREQYIIIKHYDDARSVTKVKSSRNFIPSDASKIFKTYLTEDINYFDIDDLTALQSVEQKDINKLVYGENSSIDISSTFYLFNYIQQENSIYFLRKSEDDKGSSLGFLFNIEKEEQGKKRLLELKTNLERQSTEIDQKIMALKESIPDIKSVEYQKLFPDSEFEFDSEEPFFLINDPTNKLNAFEELLGKLIEFRQVFNPIEYDKSLLYKKLNEEIINNDGLLKSLLIKSIYSSDLADKISEKNIRVSKAIEFNSQEVTSFINPEFFTLFLNDQEEESRKYKEVEKQINTIDRDLGEIGVIVSELMQEREKALNAFVKIKEIQNISENSCPLCNTEFESFSKLEEAIKFKTQTLEKFNLSKLIEKQFLIEQIKAFREKISVFTKKYIEENKLIEPEILAIVRNYTNYEATINQISESYPLLNGEDILKIVCSSIPVNKVEIDDKLAQLKLFLVSKLLKDLNYNEDEIENKNLYVQYFNSDKETLKKLEVEDFLSKKEYIQGRYAHLTNDQLQFLMTRHEKLKTIIERVNKIYDNVHRTIQGHKAEMINKIKIPFYIYSGKILQSYQQGLGIFVKINPTGQNNNVVFKTGHTSDHDIVYHLSSGQMAVVSLAFCLSLNKVYNTNQNFKFLAIDDPIQTMDDLNIHTFIELIRNEFKDYQIITSTHDDFTSRYMQYKFDKYDMKTKIQNVQKLVLEQSIF
ncbi:AAA family ATPase [Flavobacterium sp. TSSA_36]|uniref:AAA family ATPase n=1 Tax=Flavobacterium sp. TSSA_36 TaxID=3447669 RepID=UPI0028EAD5EA|nr:AAA family ATPase [uncultured Flavobacterium sp.]